MNKCFFCNEKSICHNPLAPGDMIGYQCIEANNSINSHVICRYRTETQPESLCSNKYIKNTKEECDKCNYSPLRQCFELIRVRGADKCHYCVDENDYANVCTNPDADDYYGETCVESYTETTCKYRVITNSSDSTNSDAVNHPNHYCQGGIECIKAIEASMAPEEFQGYCKGNVMKYIWRFREKNGLEDLKKAQVYLGWMIESKEKQEENK